MIIHHPIICKRVLHIPVATIWESFRIPSINYGSFCKLQNWNLIQGDLGTLDEKKNFQVDYYPWN